MYDTTKPYKKRIIELVKATWKTRYVTIQDGRIVEKKFGFPEFSSVDGVGTKAEYHWMQKSFRSLVIDALAMNLNDLAMQRATPYLLTDHLIIPEDNHNNIIEIIQHLSNECRRREIAILAGETAVHERGSLELSLSVFGFLKKVKPNRLNAGDVLIGFESNGLHSNGFTKVREIFGGECREEFTRPTKIYLETILDLDEAYDVHGMMHITGGAFTKLKDILGEEDAFISRFHNLEPHPIFKEIHAKGVSDGEMYKTFNCGIGFVIGVPEKEAGAICSQAGGKVIGEVVPG